MIQVVLFLALLLGGMASAAIAYKEGRASATAVCNTDKMEAANKALASQVASERKARQEAESRATEREQELEAQRTASNQLETENAALRASATDKGDVVFDSGDSWLRLRQRRTSTGSPATSRR